MLPFSFRAACGPTASQAERRCQLCSSLVRQLLRSARARCACIFIVLHFFSLIVIHRLAIASNFNNTPTPGFSWQIHPIVWTCPIVHVEPASAPPSPPSEISIDPTVSVSAALTHSLPLSTLTIPVLFLTHSSIISSLFQTF